MAKHIEGGRNKFFGMKASEGELELLKRCALHANCSPADLIRWLTIEYAHVNGLPVRPNLPEPISAADKLRQSRDAYDKIVNKSQSRDTDDFFTVWVFESGAERDAFHETFGLNDNRWQNGRSLAEKFKAFGEWLKENNGLGDSVKPK